MPTAEQMGMKLPDGMDYIKDGDDAITHNARQAAKWITDTMYKRGSVRPNMSIREQFYGSEWAGTWYCASGAVCATLTDLPPDLEENPRGFNITVDTMGQGVILKIRVYDVWGDAEYICNSAPSGSIGWTRWRKYMFEGDVAESNTAPPPAGFKTVPLALTSPVNASATESATAGSLRYPLHYAVPIPRWRVHVQNVNDRSGTVYPGIVSFTGAWVGPGSHTNGNYPKSAVQVMPAFKTQSDGSEFIGPWISDFPLDAATDYLLSMGYTAPAGQEHVSTYGAVWRTTNSTANFLAPAHTLSKTGPFSIWIEAEVPENVPVVAELGSSGAAGVGSTHPMLHSAIATYARKHGALPMYYAHAGSTLGIWGDPSHHKWQKWQDYARPDALWISLGQNDLFGSQTLEQVQSSTAEVLAAVRAMATHNVYMTTVPPRTAAGDETKRRQYNAWLKTRPLGVRDVFDVSAALSADDETIRPEFDADGIHANAAGGAAKVAAINRPLFEPFRRYTISQDAGRVITAWDYVNHREQMIYGDTGMRDVTSLITNHVSGKLLMQRTGNVVIVHFNDIMTSHPEAAGWTKLATIPSGFRAAVSSDQMSTYPDATRQRRRQVNYYGDVSVSNYNPNTPQIGTAVYTTRDPWPATLPGVPA